jgi:hypothetical protein
MAMVNYCDLCGVPLKGKDYYTIYSAYANNDVSGISYNEQAYLDYIKKLQKEIKEICPRCKELTDRMFEYRLEGMYKLTEQCYELFGLPEKKNPKERDNGKEKK